MKMPKVDIKSKLQIIKTFLGKRRELFSLVIVVHYMEKYLLHVRHMKLNKDQNGYRFTRDCSKFKYVDFAAVAVFYIFSLYISNCYAPYDNELPNMIFKLGIVLVLLNGCATILTRNYNHFRLISLFKKVAMVDHILEKKFLVVYDYKYFQFSAIFYCFLAWSGIFSYTAIMWLIHSYAFLPTLVRIMGFLIPTAAALAEMYYYTVFNLSGYQKLKIINKMILELSNSEDEIQRKIWKLEEMMNMTLLLCRSVCEAQKLFSWNFLFLTMTNYVLFLMVFITSRICKVEFICETLSMALLNLLFLGRVGNSLYLFKKAYNSIPHALCEVHDEINEINRLKKLFILQIINFPVNTTACGLFDINRALIVTIFYSLSSAINFIYNIFPELRHL